MLRLTAVAAIRRRWEAAKQESKNVYVFFLGLDASILTLSAGTVKN